MASNNKRRNRSTSRKRRPRRALRRLLGLLFLLAATVALGPTIVGKTPLRNTVLGLALPAEGWRIDCREATFSWTGRQTLSGVSLLDPDGKPLLTSEAISLGRSLLALAANRNQLGKLTLDRPVAYVVTRPDGSNIEDLLAEVERSWAPDQNAAHSSGESHQQLEIEIIDGEVRGLDAPSQTQWMFENANLTAQLGPNVPGGFSIEGQTDLRAGQDDSPGRMKFRLQQIADNQQQLDFLAENLTLVPIEPWLARYSPGSRLSGIVSSNAQVRWTNDPQRGLLIQTNGRLEASALEATAGVLTGDQVRCDKLSAPWQLSIAGNTITIGKLNLDAGWAKLQAQGEFSVDDLAAFSLANLPQRETKISGQVELARLAAMLPRTLQLREGVRIDSGELEFQAEGKPGDESFQWFATAALQNLAGSDGQQTIEWRQPVEAKLALVDTSAGPQVERVSLKAPFAEADFQAAHEDITGSFQIDLGEFSKRMGQFVNLDAWQIQGSGEGNLTLARKQDNRFDAAAEIELSNFHVSRDGQQIWAESSLQVDLNAEGQADSYSPKQVGSGLIKIRGGQDALDLELLEPINFRAGEATWNVRLQGNGQLSSWASRVRLWMAATPEEIAGEARVNAKIQIASGLVHVIESEVDVAQLRVRNGNMMIDEPQVSFSGDFGWDIDNERFAAREMQLVSSTLAFRSRDVAIQLASAGPPTATGTVAFRADLERLASAAGQVGDRDSTWPRGALSGNLQLSGNAHQLQADFSAQAEQLQLVRNKAVAGAAYGRPEIVWSDPQLQASGNAVYAIAGDRLELANLQVNGQTLRVAGSTTVDKLATEGLLQANGLLEYDPQALAKLVQTYLGSEIQIQGDRQVRFEIAGRLADAGSHWSRRWQASADAGWNAAAVFGLPLSGGRLRTTLGEGQLQIEPIDVAVGQGRLTASLLATLDPGPQLLYLREGPLVSHVEISPQVSEAMLKYVAPIVAGATRTKGQFSVELADAQIPLDHPKQASVTGRLDIHHLEVSPGPMVAQLVALVKQIEAVTQRKQFLQAAVSPGTSKLLSISERGVDFKVFEGRVYHRNLEFVVDNVPVRSRGSVGFDQTLALVVEVPIQDKWIERERSLQSLAGQSLQIPIQGTFQQPRIDQRAVADLSRQLLQGVAADAIGGELNRALDKLFKSR